MRPRVLVLSSTTSYRTDDFMRAAAHLGVEAVLGTNRCHELANIWPREAFGGSVPIEFRHEAEAADVIVREHGVTPFAAIVPTDDATAEIAARAAERIGLRGNSAGAAATARNKRLLREALTRAGLRQPRFVAIEETQTHIFALHDIGAVPLRYPLVLKPLLCSASRGVIRGSDIREVAVAFQRIQTLLRTPALRAVEDPDGHRILAEEFVPGAEVALEGLLCDSALTTLALFDKPDPLDGPFFEETIYVTPSRHAPELQRAVAEVTQRACAAIGLRNGPVHAELRLSPDGPVVIEVAARSIGGLCARTLRFGLGATSLEELVIRNALGLPLGAPETALARSGAAGVMMIPIPTGGVLGEVRGVERARAVPLVEDVQITAKPGQVLVPLPEGAAYLGFLFARGDAPGAVEAALRHAHAELAFDVAPLLPKLA
jgi:biotin carboxylase